MKQLRTGSKERNRRRSHFETTRDQRKCFGESQVDSYVQAATDKIPHSVKQLQARPMEGFALQKRGYSKAFDRFFGPSYYLVLLPITCTPSKNTSRALTPGLLITCNALRGLPYIEVCSKSGRRGIIAINGRMELVGQLE